MKQSCSSGYSISWMDALYCDGDTYIDMVYTCRVSHYYDTSGQPCAICDLVLLWFTMLPEGMLPSSVLIITLPKQTSYLEGGSEEGRWYRMSFVNTCMYIMCCVCYSQIRYYINYCYLYNCKYYGVHYNCNCVVVRTV